MPYYGIDKKQHQRWIQQAGEIKRRRKANKVARMSRRINRKVEG